MVLGADCVWLVELVDPFVDTVLAILAGRATPSSPSATLPSPSLVCSPFVDTVLAVLAGHAPLLP